MGPDLLGATFDRDEALRRIRARPNEEIANVLLNQRVLAGIGNIWKSETLFACRVNPFALVEAIADDKLHEIIKTARKLLRNSVDRADRNRWHVYSRGGQPCRKCGTAISSRKQGLDARLTYWCPRCQPLESTKC
jgi:endonuclease-8